MNKKVREREHREQQKGGSRVPEGSSNCHGESSNLNCHLASPPDQVRIGELWLGSQRKERAHVSGLQGARLQSMRALVHADQEACIRILFRVMKDQKGKAVVLHHVSPVAA